MIFCLKSYNFLFFFSMFALGLLFSIVSCEMGTIFSYLRCGSVTGSNYLFDNMLIHLVITFLSLF